jgi:hypothetical protein
MKASRKSRVLGVFLLLAIGAASGGCETSRDVDADLKASHAEWTARLSAIRARQAEHDKRVSAARSRSAEDTVAAQVMARRLEVIGIRAQQALTEGDRLLEEVVNDVKSAKDPQEALLQGRIRVAEYLASQEQALNEAQTQLVRRPGGEN